LNTADPENSGFKSEDEESACKATGLRIAEQLQSEFWPEFMVSVD